MTELSTKCQPVAVPRDAGEPPTEFGRTLKAVIKGRGITQTELSERAGIPLTTINGWLTKDLKGGPRLGEVAAVAKILKVSLDQLVSRVPAPVEADDFSRQLSPKEERLLELYSDPNSGFREVVNRLMKKWER